MNSTKDLSNEFDEDLKKWNAEIDKTNLSVRFKSPEILFDMGIANLKPDFKIILAQLRLESLAQIGCRSFSKSLMNVSYLS